MDGESDNDNTNRDMFLQDQFADNVNKMEELELRLSQYDMKRIFYVPTFRSGAHPSNVSDPSLLWNDDGVDIMLFWEQISWERCCYWQLTLNRRVPATSPDRTSMNWAYLLNWNSCTYDLRSQVDMKYGRVAPVFQGAVSYLWVVFHCLFSTSRDQVTSLKKFLKIFASKGLRRFKGESVVKAKIPLLAAIKRIAAIHQLNDKNRSTSSRVLPGVRSIGSRTNLPSSSTSSRQPILYLAPAVHGAMRASLMNTSRSSRSGLNPIIA